MKNLIVAVLFVFLLSCSSAKQRLVVCGDDKVWIIDPTKSEGENVKIDWQWTTSEATDLPESYQKYLGTLDECKSVDNDTKLLITASSGGAILLDKETRKSLFYAKVPMAHSAEILPNNRIVVALSVHPKGNSIELYDIDAPEKCIFRDTLYSGHGTVWMPKQKRLFALGGHELRSYSLKNWDSEQPELYLEKSWNLPSSGGHDLSFMSDNELVVTETKNVWVFNIKEESFTPFQPMNEPHVKSVNYNPKTRNLVYTKAEISWWTHNIYMQNPSKVFTIPDINLYKVRVCK